MEKKFVFSEFVAACYEYGDFLAKRGIRCSYFIGSVEHNGYESFSMYVGCADGAEIRVLIDERESKVLLRVFKNGMVNGDFKHTRFAEEYHTDIRVLFEAIEKHVDLHGGFNKRYRTRVV